MTIPDPNLGRPLGRPGTDVQNADNVQDVIPPTERNQDPLRTEQAHDLSTGNVEPKPEDRGQTVAERVYAPASERVPKEPVPGHRAVIEHTDTHTPEREAAAMHESEEPSFTRVPRPGNGGTAPGVSTGYGSTGDTPSGYGSTSSSGYGTTGSGSYGATSPSVATTPGAYASPISNPGMRDDQAHDWQDTRRQKMFMGIGFGWMTVIGCGVGVWLFMRWRAERNKPVNRLRRQAKQAWAIADEWRGRMPMPSPEEAARPAAGMGSLLIPLAIMLWRQSQNRSRQDALREEAMGRAERMGRRVDKGARNADKAARRAAQTVSDVDWQKRLLHLKENWNPSRLEMEKVQISRH